MFVTKALWRAIVRMPSASIIDTVIGSPSGTADTDSAKTKRSASKIFSPRSKSSANVIMATANTISMIWLTSLAIFF